MPKHVDIQAAITRIAKELNMTFVPTGHGFPIPDGVLIDFEKKKVYAVEIGTYGHQLSEYVGVDDMLWIMEAETEKQIKDTLKLCKVEI